MKLDKLKRKRLKFSVYAFHILVLMGLYGINKGVDLVALSVYMAATCIPVLSFILGDTLRKSE